MKTKKENTGMPSILVRLQQFMDHEKLNVYQINKESGLSKGLISNAFSNQRGLTASTLEAILNTYPQLNANWLIVGRGEMFNAEPDAAVPVSATEKHLQNLDDLQKQCVEMIKTIQQMKIEEQKSADDRLIDSLLK
jgi:transcriptional regulator with XRE-family HTH domain